MTPRTPSPILESLRTSVENTVGVEASAVAALNGVAGRIEAAVARAIENGATADELAPVQAEADSLRASADALAAAVAANQPPA